MWVASLEALAETELIDYNGDKSRYVFFGAGKARRELEEDFKTNPSSLYGRTMKESD